jgi:chemotaxis methyl-accepting protein methylase
MLIHLATNENIKGIVEGMSMSPGLRSLAVCGSGDIPFALLQFGGDVYAIDNNPNQIEFARRRKEYLEKGNFKSFVGNFFDRNIKIGDCDPVEREEYFRNIFERIRDGRIYFVEGNLRNFIFAGNFDRIYGSNVVSCLDGDYAVEIFASLKSLLKVGGFICGTSADRRFARVDFEGLVLDEELCRSAKAFHKEWQVYVYRRVV